MWRAAGVLSSKLRLRPSAAELGQARDASAGKEPRRTVGSKKGRRPAAPVLVSAVTFRTRFSFPVSWMSYPCLADGCGEMNPTGEAWTVALDPKQACPPPA